MNVPIYILLLVLAPVIVIGLAWLATNLASDTMNLTTDEAVQLATEIGIAFGVQQVVGCSVNPPPAGERIAYVNQGEDTLYLKSAIMGSPCIVTTGSVADPALSPNGERVAFTRHDDPNTDVWIVDLASGTETNLTLNIPDPASQPAWSPDGSQIAFTRLTARSNSEIWTVGSDQSNERSLTAGVMADWSPLGTRLAFIGDNPDEVTYITLINADGSGRDRLTENTVSESFPSWSPDGTRILFARPDETNIYTVNPDVNQQEYRLVANGVTALSDLQWLTEDQFAYVMNGVLHTRVFPPFTGSGRDMVMLEDVSTFDWWMPPQ